MRERVSRYETPTSATFTADTYLETFPDFVLGVELLVRLSRVALEGNSLAQSAACRGVENLGPSITGRHRHTASGTARRTRPPPPQGHLPGGGQEHGV